MAGCAGKRTWNSASAARRAHAKASFRVRPYECDECRRWHVTNSDKTGHERPMARRKKRRGRRGGKDRGPERPRVTDPAEVARVFQAAERRKAQGGGGTSA